VEKLLSLGCHPLDDCHPGWSPSDATALVWNTKDEIAELDSDQ